MKAPQGRNFYTTNKDRQFYVNQVFDWARIGSNDKEMYNALLEGAGEIIGEQIARRAPLTEKNPYRIENGNVIWPDDVKKSYEDLQKNGLLCTNISEAYGGLGLPNTITMMISEMLFQADPGFGTIPLLGSGVAEMLEAFGSDTIKKDYLDKMVTGEYTGSMDLTEPNAGSDLGGVRTKATQSDGKTYITGTKSFITNGGADVHLVLARDSDVYRETLDKTSGISLYLVPRTLDGQSNNVIVTKLEEKMGIHSSPTCGVLFDDKGAQGFIVGEKGKGLEYMFHLMNTARLGVAAQGLGTLEAAAYDANIYAEERKQFGVPISKHRLVKDMLTEMKDYAEVMRSIIYTASFATDMEKVLKEGDEFKKYRNQAAILTPVAKFFAAEKSIELTRLGLQIHGGVGYTKEFNAEKYLRDSVITTIYEGTSEIQVSLFAKDAMKSIQNPKKSRANPFLLLDEIDEGVKTISDRDMKMTAGRVRHASNKLRTSLNSTGIYLLQTQSKEKKYGDIDNVLGQAKRLSYMLAEVYGSYHLLRQSEKSDEKKETVNRFAMDMEPRADMYAAQIENQLDAQTKSSANLIRHIGSRPVIFSIMKKLSK